MAYQVMSSALYTPSLPDLDSASSFSSASSSFSIDSGSESSSSPRSFHVYTADDHSCDQAYLIDEHIKGSQRDFPLHPIKQSSGKPKKLRKQPPGLPNIADSFYTEYLLETNERAPAPESSSPRSSCQSGMFSPVHSPSHGRTGSGSLSSTVNSTIFLNPNDDSHIAYTPDSSSRVKPRQIGLKHSVAHMDSDSFHSSYPLLGLHSANAPLPPKEKDFGTRLPWSPSRVKMDNSADSLQPVDVAIAAITICDETVPVELSGIAKNQVNHAKWYLELECAQSDSEHSPTSDVYPIHTQDVYLKSGKDYRVCRELIRTEHHHLSSLQTLSSGQTQTRPPALMKRYLPALIQASESLISKMEADPTPSGVSAAFVALEEQTAKAFVSWSGVAGSFLAEPPSSRRGSVDSTASFDRDEEPLFLRRKVGMWRKRIPMLDPASFFLPTVRDLALVPTERIMRYAELFEELFSHTSESARVIVEEAVESAIAITEQCERAQTNAAIFL